ncbi:hypothetical protein J5N97_017942 [Dioscorea zingiberensis]|uniref:K-box domain-containing protein n=1 Tax=Dioscorea zingiberensis TaxID=325984 RepID=A0A9D5HH64_9LILI|nr:hypothetical protein J5N97_017942 [Dioscorea zingiberensis]
MQMKGLQPELFFKMSHEIYSYGEGLIGKVAADHSHKWVFKEPQDHEINFLSAWNNPADSQPRTWEAQFQSGVSSTYHASSDATVPSKDTLDNYQEYLMLRAQVECRQRSQRNLLATDLGSLSTKELGQLEDQVEMSLQQIRSKKAGFAGDDAPCIIH